MYGLEIGFFIYLGIVLVYFITKALKTGEIIYTPNNARYFKLNKKNNKKEF